MKDIILGTLLLFNTISNIWFWKWFIELDKTKQIKVEGIMEYYGRIRRKTK